MKPFAVIGLEVLIRRLLAKTAEGLGEMAVEDDEWVRLGMGIKAFGQEDVRPRCMGRPQNLVSCSLWIRSCLMYLVAAGSGIGGDDLIEPDGDARSRIRARLDRHLRAC